jgi:hypothetical protein
MIVSKDALATASPKTKRSVRYEFELEHTALDCVFAATNTRDFKLQIEARVIADARFERLPAYRQVAVDSYVRGALDALARMHGLAVSEPPDSVRPKPRVSSHPAKRPSVRRFVGVASVGESFPNVWTPEMKAAARKPNL